MTDSEPTDLYVYAVGYVAKTKTESQRGGRGRKRNQSLVNLVKLLHLTRSNIRMVSTCSSAGSWDFLILVELQTKLPSLHRAIEKWRMHLGTSLVIQQLRIRLARRMVKEAVVHIHNGILLSYRNECLWVSSNEVDETGAYYIEWGKSERKTPIQYINTYILNLERQ